jgi:integration host factor subunit beta
MTKSDLIERVAARLPHISKKDTEIVVNTIFDSMTEALRRSDRIEIRGFGSFQVKVREAREGRNPKTGEEVKIPAKRTPFFKVGKELKERIDSTDRAKRETATAKPSQAAGIGGHSGAGSAESV